MYRLLLSWTIPVVFASNNTSSAHEQSIVTGISGTHLKSYIGGLQLPQTI